MKKTLLFFGLLLGLNTSAQSPTPPAPGCRIVTALDADNDGFTTFNIDQYLTQFRGEALMLNYDLSGYALELYPSEADYVAGTNLISSLYNNIVAFEQFCYMKFIYSGSGPFYDSAELTLVFGCHKLEASPDLSLDMAIKKTMVIYPNPTDGLLYFEQPINNIDFYTTDGKKIQTKIQNQTMDISNLSSGIYLMEGQNSFGEKFRQKIVKK